MNLDKELKALTETQSKSWGKIVKMLSRSFEEWANNRLIERGYKNFKMGYMPFLMNIGPEGATNNELATRAKVSKQAMSKVVKELEDLNFIKVVANKVDRRSVSIFLTDKGKKFVIEVRTCVDDLSNEYKKLVGNERFQTTVEVLSEIINYHNGE